MPPARGADSLETRQLASLLRAARERAGLSARALAQRMKVSPATVVEAENGGNPRCSTLERYLGALPSLTPHALLQAASECAPPASGAAFDFIRDVHGYCVEELGLELQVAAGGQVRSELRAIRVRSLRSSLRNPIERTAILRVVSIAGAGYLSKLVDLEERPARGSWVLEEPGVRHEYRFPSALDRVGLSYRRSGTLPGLPGRERRSEGSAPVPFESGIHLPVRFPVERLVLRVRFERPAGRPPAGLPEPVAWCWLRGQAVVEAEANLAREIHPAGLPIRASSRSRSIGLTVEKPLVGLEYGVGWSE